MLKMGKKNNPHPTKGDHTMEVSDLRNQIDSLSQRLENLRGYL